VEAETWLRTTLQDLESRGVLQWERTETKYDLHPVVRGYAVSSVPADQREGVAKRLVDYFQSIPHPPWDDAGTFSDLQNGLCVTRANLHLGRLREAAQTLLALGPALLFNLEAYEEFLALLLPIFSEGWERPAPQLEGGEVSRLRNHLALCLASLGRRSEALDIHETLLLLDIDQDKPNAALTHLRAVSVLLNDLGRLYDDSRLLALIEMATTVLGTKEDLALASLWGMHSAMQRGDFNTAEHFALQFATSPHPASRLTYRAGEYEYWLTWLRFYKGGLDDATLINAEKIAIQGNNRSRIRDLYSLRGEWHLSLGQWTEAATALEEGIRMTREVSLSAADSEARLAFAQAKLGRIQSARQEAERLFELEAPPYMSLAELNLVVGNLEKARLQVLPAYEKAWADGEPYVNWWHLQRCRRVLQALGDPEPQLPKFDAANFGPLPYEGRVLEYIKRKSDGDTEALR
jgi:tetratricopeptide (TPR) repeat protein